MSLETLAYDAALRALDQQSQVLNEIRSRTGILLAASAIAASFLGDGAFKRPSPVLSAAALAAFVIIVVASVYILVPRKDKLTFLLSGTAIIEGLYEFHDDDRELRRRLTYDAARLWDGNDAEMQALFRAFRVAAAALVVEVIALAWLVSRGIL